MKYITSMTLFEKRHKTQIKQVSDGIEWVVDGKTHSISKEALGIYKRAGIHFYMVLRDITKQPFLNGNITTAKKLIKRNYKLNYLIGATVPEAQAILNGINKYVACDGLAKQGIDNDRLNVATRDGLVTKILGWG